MFARTLCERFDVPSINASCLIFNVPNPQSRFRAQPVYQVSLPSLFVGSFITSTACKFLHFSSDPEITISSTLRAMISSTLPSTTMRNTYGSDLHCYRWYSTTVSTDNPATAVHSALGHPVFCIQGRYSLTSHHTHWVVSHKQAKACATSR